MKQVIVMLNPIHIEERACLIACPFSAPKKQSFIKSHSRFIDHYHR